MQKYNFNNYKIKIGSRRSPLAVWQAQAAMKRLGENTQLIKISTSGDKKLHKKLERQASKKGLTGKQKEKFVYGTLSKVERRLSRRKNI